MKITIKARRWFDKVYGNTYFSCRIYKDGGLIKVIPMQYGYGNHFEDKAIEYLKETKLLPDLARYELNKLYSISVSVNDGLKCDLDHVDPANIREYQLATPPDTLATIPKKSMRAAVMHFRKYYKGTYQVIERDGYGKFISSKAVSC